MLVTFGVPFLNDGQYNADTETADQTENFGDDDPESNGKFVVVLRARVCVCVCVCV